MKGLLIDWFYNPKNVQDNIFDQVVATLFDNVKITNYSYTILKQNNSPIDTEIYWFDALTVEGDINCCIIHNNNFTCSIETQLRAFYFKIFHRAICTNKFLYKIGRIDSPFCFFL